MWATLILGSLMMENCQLEVRLFSKNFIEQRALNVVTENHIYYISLIFLNQEGLVQYNLCDIFLFNFIYINIPIIDNRPHTIHMIKEAPTEPTSFITPFGDMNMPKK